MLRGLEECRRFGKTLCPKILLESFSSSFSEFTDFSASFQAGYCRFVELKCSRVQNQRCRGSTPAIPKNSPNFSFESPFDLHELVNWFVSFVELASCSEIFFPAKSSPSFS